MSHANEVAAVVRSWLTILATAALFQSVVARMRMCVTVIVAVVAVGCDRRNNLDGLLRDAEIRDLLVPGGLVAVCDGTPQDTSILWKISLSMTVGEQLGALAPAGFTQTTLDGSIGAMILVTGRRSTVSVSVEPQ